MLAKEMASASSKISRTGFHARSVSLPSRPHPTVPEYDEILRRIQSSESASSSSLPMRNNLEGLHDLYNCVDSLMLLPETQLAIAKDCSGKWIDEVLDGSLRMLDVCGTAKDSLSITKECTLALQSSLRRKGNDVKEAGKYLACRKAVKKSMQNALRNLKGLESTKKEQNSLNMVSMLREVEQVTLSVLESLLSLISGQKEQSLVSRMMLSKSSKSEWTNEFQLMDSAMQSVTKHKAVEIDHIQRCVADLNISIEDLESGVEFLYRHLLKMRVTLLNIISN